MNSLGRGTAMRRTADREDGWRGRTESGRQIFQRYLKRPCRIFAPCSLRSMTVFVAAVCLPYPRPSLLSTLAE